MRRPFYVTSAFSPPLMSIGPVTINSGECSSAVGNSKRTPALSMIDGVYSRRPLSLLDKIGSVFGNVGVYAS